MSRLEWCGKKQRNWALSRAPGSVIRFFSANPWKTDLLRKQSPDLNLLVPQKHKGRARSARRSAIDLLFKDQFAISWGAIVAGGVAAAALTLTLLSFGSAMGFSSVSPWP